MIRRIIALAIKEFLVIWKDPKSRVLIFIPPLLQLLIFSHAATMEIKNIDMAVFDASQTKQSRDFINQFKHSIWFKNVHNVNNEAELRHLVQVQKTQAGLLIDNNFAKNIAKGKSADVQLILDGRQTNTAGIIGGYVSTIATDYQNRFYPNFSKNAPAINVSVRNWFNPNLIYIWYTAISLVMILATTTALMLTSLSIARERELGTFDQLIVSPLSPFEILMGKTIPPLIISILLATAMGFMALNLFDIPFNGSLKVFLCSLFVFLLSIVGVGLFISSICKTQQQSILGVFAFQMPGLLISGYISPIDDMPILWQHISAINPLRYFLVIIKGLTLKEMSTSCIIENLIPLLIIGIITLSIAGWMFRKNLD